jgi:hypothetical protein
MTKKTFRPIRVEGAVAFVAMTRGFEAQIDAADVHLVEGRHWVADVDAHTVYAVTKYRRNDGEYRTVPMHRLLCGWSQGLEVDHIDGNGLNNRRGNLRLVTSSENKWNQKIRVDNKSGVKGVCWISSAGKWRAQIARGGKKISLGHFESIEDAAAAYAKASVELHGQYGRTA